MIKFADDVTFGAMLNNDLKRYLLQEGLITKTMGTNSVIPVKLYVQHLGEKHLEERGDLHNRGSEKDGNHDDRSNKHEFQSGPAPGVVFKCINRRLCSDKNLVISTIMLPLSCL